MNCKECKHFETHCEFLLNRKGTETECDWTPSRFKRVECEHKWSMPVAFGNPAICLKCGLQDE